MATKSLNSVSSSVDEDIFFYKKLSVNNKNEVEFRAIEIMEDTTEGLWISGLPASARIITLGQEYVFQGQVVEVKEMSGPEA